MFYIDGHCDSLNKVLDKNVDLNDETLQFNLKKAKAIGGGIQIMAAFINSKYVTEKNEGINRCLNIINKLKEHEKIYNVNVQIQTALDIENAVKNSDVKAILSVENGSAISGNLNNVDLLHDLGVKIMSITWDDDNDLRMRCQNDS